MLSIWKSWINMGHYEFRVNIMQFIWIWSHWDVMPGSARFVVDGGGCLSPPPQVCIEPSKKIVEVSQKYIADPRLVFPRIEYCS